jgi:hypothetical protein
MGDLGYNTAPTNLNGTGLLATKGKRDLFAPDRYTTASSTYSTVRGPPDSRRLGVDVGKTQSAKRSPCSTAASDWPPIRVQEFLAAWICQPLNPRKEFVLRQLSQRIFIVVLKFLPRGCPSQNRASR